MMRHYPWAILCLICVVAVHLGYCLVPSSVTYQVKTSNYLGVTMKMGEYEVKFDEDVYQQIGFNPCSSYSCAGRMNYSDPAETCDATQPGFCSSTVTGDGCDPYRAIVCANGQLIGQVIDFNSTVPGPSQCTGSPLYYFYYVDESMACQYLNYYLDTTWGMPNFAVLTLQNFADFLAGSPSMEPLTVWVGIGNFRTSVCPGQLFPFKLGTHVISAGCQPNNVWGPAGTANYSLDFQTRQIPPEPVVTTPCSVPANVPLYDPDTGKTLNHSDWQCLDDGIPFNFTPSTTQPFKYLVYTVPKGSPCVNLMWYCYSYLFSIGYVNGSDFAMPLATNDYEGVDKNVATNFWLPRTDFLTICPSADEDYSLLFKSIPNPVGQVGIPVFSFIMVDSSQNYRERHLVASYSEYVASWELTCSTTLTCTSDTGQVTRRQCCNNWPLIFGVASECERYWMYMPSEAPNPISPVPAAIQSHGQFRNTYATPSVPSNRTYNSAFLLELQDGVSTVIPQGASEFPTCRIVFMGSIVGADGVPVPPTPLTPVPREPECSNSLLLPILSQQTALTGALASASLADSMAMANLRLDLDVLAHQPGFYDCTDMALNISQTVASTRDVISDQCVTYDATDPCCNPAVSWSADNCVPRSVNTTTLRYQSLTALGQEMCALQGTSQCAGCVAADFISSFDNINSPTDGCGANTPNAISFRNDIMREYRICQGQWLGSTGDLQKGHPCSYDSDCTLLPGATCDLFRHSCNYPVTQLAQGYLSCFLPTLNGYVKSFTANALQIANPDDVSQWLAALSTPDCTGTYNWAPAFRNSSYSRQIATAVNSGLCEGGKMTFGLFSWYCPSTMYCASSFCLSDFACQMVDSVTANIQCGHQITSNAATANCETYSTCPWTSGYAPQTEQYQYLLPTQFVNPLTTNFIPAPVTNCSSTDHVCAVCESGSDQPCVAVNLDPASCSSSSGFVGCVLNNGSVIATTPSECASIFSCSSQYIDDATCSSGTAGLCDDYEWMWSNGTLHPGCIVPPAPLWAQGPDCPQIDTAEFGRSTPLGCIYYSHGSNCAGLSALINKNATLFTPALTEALCTAPSRHRCYEAWDASYLLNDHMLTLKPDSICVQNGGKVVNATNWTAATWRAGVQRPLTLVDTTVPLQPVRVTPTLNFALLDTTLLAAISNKYASFEKSETYCRYNNLAQTLGPLSCACASDRNTSQDCFPQVVTTTNGIDASQASAILSVCPDVNLVNITAFPIISAFNTTQSTNCINVAVNIIGASLLSQAQAVSLSTFLLDFSSDQIDQFTNTHRALVGQIVSDGVLFTYSSASGANATTADLTALNSVLVCVVPRTDIQLYNTEYSVQDFGYVDMSTGSKQVVWMGLQAFTDETTNAQCAYIPSISSSYAYFPIVRTADADTRGTANFTPGEKAFYACMCVLYLSMATFAFVFCVRIALARSFNPTRTQNWIYVTIFLMTAIRGIYIILVLTGTVINNSSTAIDYIFVELPSFLYFTTMTFFVIIWASLMKLGLSLRMTSRRPNFWPFFFILNGSLYALFIILIIIYESVAPHTESLCGGRLEYLNQTVRQRTALAFRCILACVAAAISLAFFVTGIGVYKSLSYKAQTAKGSRRLGLKIKIFWLTSVCSLGLLALSVLLITIAATGYHNNYLVLSLLVLFEVGPCFLVTLLLGKPQGLESGSTKRTAGRTSTTSPTRGTTASGLSFADSGFSSEVHDDEAPTTPHNASELTPTTKRKKKKKNSSNVSSPRRAASPSSSPTSPRRKKSSRSPKKSNSTKPKRPAKPAERTGKAAAVEDEEVAPVATPPAPESSDSSSSSELLSKNRHEAPPPDSDSDEDSEDLFEP